eukprot:Hpha_TRINITY_DN5050_c0_g1::TRINITY_DN5050_c0_g1_i1::g.94028::m.94028
MGDLSLVMKVTGTVLAAAAGYYWYVARRGTREAGEGENVIVLHKRETSSTGYWGHPGICTVTFCKGSAQAALKALRPRVLECLKANPWIGGRLDGKRRLVYPSDTQGLLDEILIPRVIQNAAVTKRTPYAELMKATGGNKELAVQGGAALQNSGGRVTKLVLVENATGSGEFAVVFSMSHVVADGHDYYKILNMITGTAEPTALDPRRVHEYEDREWEWTGKKDFGWLSGGGLIKGMLGGLLFGPKSEWRCHYVDEDKVATAKRGAVGVPFVSTNDVVTSHFCKAAQARVAMMVINMRDKIGLEGLTDNTAGCYEGCLLLDAPNYSTPSSIRACLRGGVPFTRRHPESVPLPGVCGGSCPMALITSWASFPWEMRIEGVTQLLHLPCMDMPDMMDVAVVFRPQPSRLGMLYLAKRSKGRLLWEGSILGDAVSDDVFPSV